MKNEARSATPLYDAETAEHFLRVYLREAPLATSLWRAIEAASMTGVTMEHPVLDIGCAFGEFARVFFSGKQPPDVGVDIDRSELLRCTADPVYKAVVQCDARVLPFPDASFETVMSVSTLEHIPDAEITIADAARVLRPGGVLAFTVPIESFNTNLIGHNVLRRANRTAADRYATTLHRQLTHVNIWPQDRWIEATTSAGLAIETARAIVSPSATRAFEALLPAAFANRIWRQATGNRPPHPEAFVNAAIRLMRPLAMQQSEGGSNLFIVARKPAS